METKSYKVKLVNEKELEKDIEIVSEKIDSELKEQFQSIYNEMGKMEIQQRLFFIDRVLIEFMENSHLPSFYLKALLSRVEDYVKDMNEVGPLKEEVVTKQLNYVG